MPSSKINLTPEVLDLTLYAGDGFSFSLAVTDASADPIPLTGDMLAQIRVTRLETNPPATTFLINQDQATQGIVTLSLTGIQTQALSDGTPPTEKFVGEWDIQWTPINAQPITLCQGKVECLPDVSR